MKPYRWGNLLCLLVNAHSEIRRPRCTVVNRKKIPFVVSHVSDGHLNGVDEERRETATLTTASVSLSFHQALFVVHAHTHTLSIMLFFNVLSDKKLLLHWRTSISSTSNRKETKKKKQTSTYGDLLFVGEHCCDTSAHLLLLCSRNSSHTRTDMPATHLRTRVQQVKRNVLSNNRRFIDLEEWKDEQGQDNTCA